MSRPGGSTPARAHRDSSAAQPERLLEAGFANGDVDRILELVPLATHNQREGNAARRHRGADQAEHLVEIVEHSMSSPVYELLKRPDELFVVEHAHLQPRFVEDSVRFALKAAIDRYPDLADTDFLFAQQVNLETIHRHDVLAERTGTVGEVRGELAGHAASRHRAARLARDLAPPEDRPARGSPSSDGTSRCAPAQSPVHDANFQPFAGTAKRESRTAGERLRQRGTHMIVFPVCE